MKTGKPSLSTGGEVGVPRASQLQIAELGRKDAQGSGDLLSVLRRLISSNDPQYPGIDLWFARKVVPGLISGERKAYLAFSENRPIGAAILKRGKSAKFCHVRVDENYQGVDLGQIFFIHMTIDSLEQSEQIHFTLPESLWAVKSGFFRSFGFSDVKKSPHFYRTGDSELSCSAPISSVFSAAVKKLPQLLKKAFLGRHSASSDLLMSVKSTFAKRIFEGSKSVEIRKRFSEKWVGHDAVLYATKPLGSILGQTTIRSITSGNPNDLWAQFQSRMGCSKNEFDAYVGDASKIAAIEFDNIRAYESPVPVCRLADLLSLKLLAPQSFSEVSFEKNCDWKRALYLANLLRHRKANNSNNYVG